MNSKLRDDLHDMKLYKQNPISDSLLKDYDDIMEQQGKLNINKLIKHQYFHLKN